MLGRLAWEAGRQARVVGFLKGLIHQYGEFIDWSSVVYDDLPAHVQWLLREIPSSSFAEEEKRLFSLPFEEARQRSWLEHLSTVCGIPHEGGSELSLQELRDRVV